MPLPKNGRWRTLRAMALSALFLFACAGTGLALDPGWNTAALPVSDGALFDLAMQGDEAWAAGSVIDQGTQRPLILYSSDGGQNWAQQDTGAWSGLLRACRFTDTQSGYAVGQSYADGMPLILYTENGGLSWAQATVPAVHGSLYGITSTAGGVGWAGGKDLDNGRSLLLKSADGVNWTQAAHPAQANGTINRVAFPDALTGYAGGTASDMGNDSPFLLKTGDGGDTWATVNLPYATGVLEDVFFQDADTGWIAGGDGTAALIYKTENGGGTWTPMDIPEGTVATRVSFHSPGTAVINRKEGDVWRGSLYQCSDGANWAPLTPELAGYFLQTARSTPYGFAAAGFQYDLGTPMIALYLQEALAQIIVSPANASLIVGQPQQYGAEGQDASGNPVPINPVWSATGGTVTQGGEFTPDQPGDFTVSVTDQGITGNANGNAAYGQLTSIDVIPKNAQLVVGQEQQYDAVGYDANGTMVPINPVWSATGGTVTQGGEFTPDQPGDFTVTVTDQGITGTANGNAAYGQLTSIDVIPKNAQLMVGQAQVYDAMGYDANGTMVPINPVWTADIGTVTQAGLYTAPLTPGNDIVTVTDQGITGTANVTTVPGPLNRIEITPSSCTLKPGQTQPFTLKGYDQGGNEVPLTAPVWTATDGTVTQAGLYTAPLTPGNDIVTVTDQGITGTANVTTVPGPLNRIEITPSSCTLKPGQTQPFTLKGYDQSGNEVPLTDPVWSADTGTVTQGGLYTAPLTPGNDEVTVTEQGVTGTADIEILPAGPNSIGILPADVTVPIGWTQAFTAVAFDKDGNPVPIQNPVWSATYGGITQGGLYTPPQFPGKDTVTVKYQGLSATTHLECVPAGLSSIEVLPKETTVKLGWTQAFVASAFDRDGNLVPIKPEWSATGGGITQDGLYTAWEQGDFTVYAQDRFAKGFLGEARVHVGKDGDGDGAVDASEAFAPNIGDGNGDGILDSVQKNVTSLAPAKGEGWITVETDCEENLEVNAHGDAMTGGDTPWEYPLGMVSFKLPCPEARVRIFFHGMADPAGTMLRKFGPTPPDFTSNIWYALPGAAWGTAVIGGKTVHYAEFTLKDGELGDKTPKDGFIVDPIGPALPAAEADQAGGGGGGSTDSSSSCFIESMIR